ncbi:MAG: MFS transporter [Euryarchaeota archaeon]|nr:MFS transporter [Euryarchaeota archaeon]
MFKPRLQRESKVQTPRQLLLFSTIFFLFSVFIGAIITVHPLYLNQFLEKAELVGLVAAITSLAGMAFSIPAGVLSDKLGRKRLLIASFLLLSAVLLVFFLNTHLYALIVLQIAFGFAMAPAWVISEAFIKDISPVDRRGEFRSVFGTFANAGMFIGPVIGGLLADQFNIRTPYLFSALLLLASLLLVFKLKDYNRNSTRNAKSNGMRREDLLAVLKEFGQHRELNVLALCTVALFFWYSAKWVFGPLLLHHLGYSPFVIGVWMGISAAPFLLFQIPLGKIGDRIGKTRLICLGFVISTIFIIPLGFLTSLPSLLVTIFIISLGTTFVEPLIEARVTDIAPRERYGAYSGIFEFAKTSGSLLGPVSSALFVYLFGISYSFIPSVILFILTLALFLYTRQSLCKVSTSLPIRTP